MVFPLENTFILSTCTHQVLLANLALCKLDVRNVRAMTKVLIVGHLLGVWAWVLVKFYHTEVVT